MARYALVVTQRWQRELRPDGRVAKVDVVGGGGAAIEGTILLIAVGHAGFDRRGHALDQQVRFFHSCKRTRQAHTHVGNQPVQIGEQLGTPRVIVGIQKSRILVQCAHALAHGA